MLSNFATVYLNARQRYRVLHFHDSNVRTRLFAPSVRGYLLMQLISLTSKGPCDARSFNFIEIIGDDVYFDMY